MRVVWFGRVSPPKTDIEARSIFNPKVVINPDGMAHWSRQVLVGTLGKTLFHFISIVLCEKWSRVGYPENHPLDLIRW
jgi:hypothetical protein